MKFSLTFAIPKKRGSSFIVVTLGIKMDIFQLLGGVINYYKSHYSSAGRATDL